MTDLLVVAHSGAGGERARVLFAGRRARIETPPSPLAAAASVMRLRPRRLYLVDVGARTVGAALAAWLLRIPYIIDTGDVVYELERSRGTRSSLGLAAVWIGERAALRWARHVVVRGRRHADLLRGRPVTIAPDLAPPSARPTPGNRIRELEQLGSAFVVGLVGSLYSAPALGTSYGWDLVEALPHTPPGVEGLVVGDGDARQKLEGRARELGIADRCHFVGRVALDDVPEWIGAMDAAISTQTNDVVGAVRTTGKLPLYLACGCPVLASDVGEAHDLLGPLGWTIPYDGVVDFAYPKRLAAAIRRWADDRSGAEARREQALEVHRRAFDPNEVRRRVWAAVESLRPSSHC